MRRSAAGAATRIHSKRVGDRREVVPVPGRGKSIKALRIVHARDSQREPFVECEPKSHSPGIYIQVRDNLQCQVDKRKCIEEYLNEK